MVVERLDKFRGIFFGYKINVFTDQKSLVYATNQRESQQVMNCQLILKYFGPNIQHISGADNISAGTISR